MAASVLIPGAAPKGIMVARAAPPTQHSWKIVS
jgi:hypothetical protein